MEAYTELDMGSTPAAEHLQRRCGSQLRPQRPPSTIKRSVGEEEWVLI